MSEFEWDFNGSNANTPDATYIIVTTASVPTTIGGLNGVQGFAVTSVSGEFRGNPITGEVGLGGGVSSFSPTLTPVEYDNTVFLSSGSGYNGTSYEGLDSLGILFSIPVPNQNPIVVRFSQLNTNFYFDEYLNGDVPFTFASSSVSFSELPGTTPKLTPDPDGTGVLDSSTGIEWLPLSDTFGYTYSQISGGGDPLAWVRGLEAHARNPKDKSVGYRRRIPGVCLCRGGGFGCLDHGHELLRC
jgi:hypothetical protein